MMKKLKKGLCLLGIYTFSLILIYSMSDRITRLDSNNDFRNSNGSVVLKK